MKKGDVLYCNKEYANKNNNDLIFQKGTAYIVNDPKYRIGGKTVISISGESYSCSENRILKNIRLTITEEELCYFESKQTRIRRIAKEFIV